MGKSNGYYTGNDALEFSQIVLNYVNKILDILSRELRERKTIIPQSGTRSEIQIDEEDTRKSFTQTVEGLATILTPWFDDGCKTSFASFNLIINGSRAEYYKKYKKEILEELKLQKELKINIFDEANQKFVNFYREWHQVIEGKNMFRTLNMLLHSNDYLKGSVYGEGSEGDE